VWIIMANWKWKFLIICFVVVFVLLENFIKNTNTTNNIKKIKTKIHIKIKFYKIKLKKNKIKYIAIKF
jgi:LAS superfamily LD-carboxypeptidase LdcB